VITSNSILYLDHAATTPLRLEARAAMEPFLQEAFGNPSGIHEASRTAKAALEDARERAAELIGAAHPLDVVFTGGGTESDNLALVGPVLAGTGGVVTTSIEHEAVAETASFLGRLGREVVTVGVDANGVVDPLAIADAVTPATEVVSVMAANNETGVRQPVSAVVEAVRAAGSDVLVHTDAVQEFISEDVTLDSTGADLITLASHKFGGPKGVGLLHVARSVSLEPVLHGGGQEIGRRSGTHNVAGIVGMVAAMEIAAGDRERFRSEVGAERDGFERALITAIADAQVTAAGALRLSQHSHFRIPGIDAETLLIRLDGSGVAASAGSACQSGAIETSHVLAAMGVDPVAAAESVRFSFGWTTKTGDGAAAARAVATTVADMR
jgi:cysteine desulfurase